MEKSTDTDRKNYEFKNGIVAHQEECTREQDSRLLPLLQELEIPDMDDIYKMTLVDLAQKIYTSPVLDKIFDVIVIIDANEYDQGWNSLKRSEVIQVIEDFFTLSPGLKKLFGIGRSAADSPQTSDRTTEDLPSDLK